MTEEEIMSVPPKTADECLGELAVDEKILIYFKHGHLPESLASVSSGFAYLAMNIVKLPRSAERTVALRKLLESKDAAVRAALPAGANKI